MKATTKRKIGAALTILLFGSIFAAIAYHSCIEAAVITFIASFAILAFARLCENLLNSQDAPIENEAEKLRKEIERLKEKQESNLMLAIDLAREDFNDRDVVYEFTPEEIIDKVLNFYPGAERN